MVLIVIARDRDWKSEAIEILQTPLKLRHLCWYVEKSWFKFREFILKMNKEANFNGDEFCIRASEKTPYLKQGVQTEKRSNRCMTCGKSFAELRTLKRHILTHSGDKLASEKRFICMVCEQSFSTSLKVHLVKHTGEKAFRCGTCGKQFGYANSLRKHMLIHSGDKPYKCEFCDASFRQTGALQAHTLIHTGIRPHICRICGNTFTQPSSLKQHMLIHTGEKQYNCDDWRKSFRRLTTLQEHLFIHTGEKPFVCESCGSAFRHSKSLKNHTLLHTGEKPYKCEVCEKTFIQRSNLRTTLWFILEKNRTTVRSAGKHIRNQSQWKNISWYTDKHLFHYM